jgi:hypothetical protein
LVMAGIKPVQRSELDELDRELEDESLAREDEELLSSSSSLERSWPLALPFAFSRPLPLLRSSSSSLLMARSLLEVALVSAPEIPVLVLLGDVVPLVLVERSLAELPAVELLVLG